MAFWHGRILPAHLLLPHRGIVVITSDNFDGEWIARIIHRFGFATVRGIHVAQRGARRAQGQAADGRRAPVGLHRRRPARPGAVAQPGAIWLAKATGNPVLPFHLEAASHWTRRSWDAAQVPLPFSRSPSSWASRSGCRAMPTARARARGGAGYSSSGCSDARATCETAPCDGRDRQMDDSTIDGIDERRWHEPEARIRARTPHDESRHRCPCAVISSPRFARHTPAARPSRSGSSGPRCSTSSPTRGGERRRARCWRRARRRARSSRACTRATTSRASRPRRGRAAMLDTDTFTSPETARLRSPGGGRGADGRSSMCVDGVGRSAARLALVRPPGHHAEPTGRWASASTTTWPSPPPRRSREGFERVAIVDYDVHHGNGTQ